MKLLGRDIDANALLDRVEQRLRARSLAPDAGGSRAATGVEPRIDPLSFNLTELEEHADPTRPLPLHTHRGGIPGRALLLAKWTFRATCQLFINEALARQRLFNGHVRDSYAQLSAEVLKLQQEMEAMGGEKPPKRKQRSRRTK